VNWRIVSEALPEAIDRWRLIPRAFVFGYGVASWQVMQWFMGLPEPNGPQSAFVSTVAGMASVIFGFYVNSGCKKRDTFD